MKKGFVILCILGAISEISLNIISTNLSKSRNSLCSPIRLANGIIKRRARGRVVRFFCSSGFLLAGEKHSTCTRGKWDPEPPKCVRPTCKAVTQQPSNLLIYPTHNGAVQHFFCKAGYELNGPRDIYCNGTKWNNNNLPTCKTVNESPSLSCDFETTDLCGWTHDLNHDFDWRREKFDTPSGSIGTGPSFDHTKGPGQDGNYMYIESSSRVENDTARLISPVYKIKSDDICFEFFYHMYGGTVGTLNVYLKRTEEDWSLNANSAFFSKRSNQGDRWYRSFHHLGRIDSEFQIIIEGVRGNGYVSDIAIDDVKLIPDCLDEIEITTTIDSSTYNDVTLTVDNCQNRCGQKEDNTSNIYHLTCDCDDDCYIINRCCPDIYDTCGGAFNMTDGDAITDTIDEIISTELRPTPAEPKQSDTTVKTTQKITTSRPLQAITQPQTNSSIVKLVTTANPKRTTLSTTKSVPTNPIIYIQTKPVTLPIIRRTTSTLKPITIKTSTVKTTMTPRVIEAVITTSKPTTTRKVTTRKLIVTTTVKPTLPMKTTTTMNTDKKERKFDDVIEVPKPPNNDEDIYDPISGSKEFWSDEIENNVDTPFTSNFNESNKLFSQVSKAETNSHFVPIAIGVCCSVILITIVAFVVIKRYNLSRTLQSSNGESQSDVRYLTNSDMLDLSLANSYEELIT